MNLNEIIKKDNNDWKDYYLKEDENEDLEDIGELEDKNLVMSEMVEDEEHENEKNPILNFTQAKTKNRTFANRGDYLDIYKIDQNDDKLNYLTNLPIVNSYDQKINFGKITMTDRDHRMLIIDNFEKNKIYDYDV